MLKGVAASPGISIGHAVYIQPPVMEIKEHTIPVAGDEKQRFLDAVEEFVRELEDARKMVLCNAGKDEAAILDVQIEIIRDEEMIAEVLRIIDQQNVNAEYAFSIILNGYIALFSNMEDEFMAARSADFVDIRDRMLRILLGIRATDLRAVSNGSILVAEDIPPSQAAEIDPKRIVGIAMAKGTPFSHISILSRALGIPTVVAIPSLFDLVQNEDTLILDGNTGCLWANPDSSHLQTYYSHLRRQARQQEYLSRFRNQPTLTADGQPFRLSANLTTERELEQIAAYNPVGIGLYRSEFAFMERHTAPTEDEQYEQYKHVVLAMEGKPVVIRTLDIGGDKPIPYLFSGDEQNPFLGYRAMRFCLDHPDMFKVQLSAILRSAAHGDVCILLPMINDSDELHQAKHLIQETEQELEVRGLPHGTNLPVGVMIETPAAVLCASELAAETDFFSIGSNDLTQYTLAVDRTNSHVASRYNPLHPAVLRMIAMAVDAAHKAGIPVCVCGEAATDPYMLCFLLSCGIDETSVNAGSLLLVRSMLRQLSASEWRGHHSALLSLGSSTEIRAYIDKRIHKKK